LTKVEGILHEDAMPISGAMGDLASPTCTHNSPSVASVGTSVPEEHASMATFLEHLKPDKMPPSALMLRGFPIAPTVQAIIVDCVAIVDPQLTPIIGDDAKPVMACSENSQAACPTHSKVITSFEATPFLSCVAIVHDLAPTSHVRFAASKVRAPATLTEVKCILHEDTMAISRAMATCSPATCTHNGPSIAGVWTAVPEQHAGMTTTFEHLKPHKTPPGTHVPSGLSIAPTVQAIVVNCVAIVDPQLTPIIRDDAEMIMTCPEDSHAAGPTHSKVITSSKSRPLATCIAVVHHLAPASHVRPATIQVLASPTLAKIERILSKDAMAICKAMSATSATCAYDEPSISSIMATVSE
jgi:hypothetical protein